MTFRKILFWTHLAVGLTIALLMAAIAGSGLVLAAEPSVMGWAERDWASVPRPVGQERLSMDTLAAKALEETGAEAVTGFTLQRDALASVRLQLGRDKAVYMDPYTGGLMGEGAVGWQAFFKGAEDLHRWFLITGNYRDASHQVKEAANAFFLLMILSGLYLWLPKVWNRINLRKIIVPNFSASGKARDFNWHNVAGLWASPFILLICLTGLVMSYGWASDLLFTLSGNTPPPRPQRPAASAPMPGDKADAAGKAGRHRGEGAEGKPQGHAEGRGDGQHRHGHDGEGKPHKEAASASLEAYVKAADVQVPGWISLSFRQARQGQDTVMLTVQTQDLPLPRGRGTLTLKAADASVDKWEPFETQNSGRRLKAWARWAHTGQAFGLTGEILAGLACLAVLLQVYTGLALSWRRFFNSPAPAAVAQAAPVHAKPKARRPAAKKKTRRA